MEKIYQLFQTLCSGWCKDSVFVCHVVCIVCVCHVFNATLSVPVCFILFLPSYSSCLPPLSLPLPLSLFLSLSLSLLLSNGELDPWSGCGVLEDVSDSLIAVIIKDGAHHLDLRASNDKDTDSVKAARETHKESIAKWLMDYYSKDGRLRQGVL